jgi:hypothetical protein
MVDNSGSKKDHIDTQAQSPVGNGGQEIQDYAQWTHTGQFRDHGAAKAVCQLCGNTGLRYHFLVAHRKTGEAIWVGSQCILNFDLPPEVVKARKSQFKKQTAAEKDHQQLMVVLREAQEIYECLEERDRWKIRWIVGRYQQRGGFSPADLAWLFQAMAIGGLVPSFHNYPVVLRSKADRYEIKNLGVTGLRMISICLSAAQRKKCEAWGIRLNVD